MRTCLTSPAPVVLTTFICHLLNGTPRLTEHQEIRWLSPQNMPKLEWAPADRDAVQRISIMDLKKNDFSSNNQSTAL